MKNISCLTRVRPSINRRKKFNLIPRMVKKKKKKKKKCNGGSLCGGHLWRCIGLVNIYNKMAPWCH